MKKIIYILIIILLLCIVSCNSSNDIDNFINDAEKSINNEENKSNIYVKQIMNGYLNIDTSVTIGTAFENFFSYPTWEHFTSTEQTNIVEFTGNCMYDNKEVTCVIQFTLTGDSFEITYLSFNDISQNTLTVSALLNSIYDHYYDEHYYKAA